MFLMMPASMGWIKDVIFLGRNSTLMWVRLARTGCKGVLSTRSRVLQFFRHSSLSHFLGVLSQIVLFIQAFFDKLQHKPRLAQSRNDEARRKFLNGKTLQGLPEMLFRIRVEYLQNYSSQNHKILYN